MDATIIAALARHLLTAVAGVFATRYALDQSAVDAVVAGATALTGIGWSILQKRKAA